jgi:predicted nucleic acid-binding protein
LIVIDASVLANVLADDRQDGRRARAQLRETGEDLAAPDLLDVETISVLRKRWLAAHDAAYVALAELLDCELLTADQRLAHATGPRCTIRLVR